MIQSYPSAVRNASFVGDAFDIGALTTLIASIDVTAVPGVQTVTLSVEHEIAGGTFVPLGATAARDLVGRDELQIGPDLIAVANSRINALVGRRVRLRVTHSGAANFTYSLRLEARP